MSDSSKRTPAEWKIGGLSYGAGLTLKVAKKMLEAGEKEAVKQGVPVVIAVVDAGGNLLAFSRMDNALLMSINIAIDKAYTAVIGKMPTSHWNTPFKRGNTPLFLHERCITLPGGFPVIRKGVILGGIGISGGTVEDLHIARTALEAGKFSTADVDSAILAVRQESA